MSRRVVVLGLDGATWDLLQPWMQAGELPHLARLQAGGAWGRLRSTMPPFSATAWSTFATGVNAGQHGVFDFWYHAPDGRRLPIDATHLRAPTLWQRLSEAGKRVAVFNVPITYPPVPVNGILVAGMLTPPDAETFTHPPELSADLRARGSYRPDPFAAVTQGTRLLHEARASIEQQEAAHRHLFAQEKWDFCLQVTMATDVIQHLFWTYLHEGEADYDAPEGSTYRRLALAVYRQLDDIIGHRMQSLDGDDVLVVMSDHGFGAAYDWFNVNRLLADKGFLKLASARPQPRFGLTQERVLGLLRRLDVLRLRGRFRNRLRLRVREWVDHTIAPPIDWTQTVAYADSNSAEAVYLNVRGREPHGIVEPGAAYEATRDAVIDALRAAQDPARGLPIFEGVHRREDLYHGPYVGHAPDIVLEVGSRAYAIASRLSSPHWVEPIPRQAARGRHHPDGILALYGDAVRPGQRIEGARLLDMAPTLLTLLGQPIPALMEGKVLHDAFRVALTPQQAAGDGVAPAPDGGAAPVYTDEEQAWIEERLRSLGYIE